MTDAAAAVTASSSEADGITKSPEANGDLDGAEDAEVAVLVRQCRARLSAMQQRCAQLAQSHDDAVSAARAAEAARDEALQRLQAPSATPTASGGVTESSGGAKPDELAQLRTELDASKTKLKEVVVLLMKKEQQLGAESKRAAKAEEMLTQFESWRGSDLATLTRELEEQLGASNGKLSEACAARDELEVEVRQVRAERDALEKKNAELREKLGKAGAVLKIMQSKGEQGKSEQGGEAEERVESSGEAASGKGWGWFSRK